MNPAIWNVASPQSASVSQQKVKGPKLETVKNVCGYQVCWKRIREGESLLRLSSNRSHGIGLEFCQTSCGRLFWVIKRFWDLISLLWLCSSRTDGKEKWHKLWMATAHTSRVCWMKLCFCLWLLSLPCRKRRIHSSLKCRLGMGNNLVLKRVNTVNTYHFYSFLFEQRTKRWLRRRKRLLSPTAASRPTVALSVLLPWCPSEQGAGGVQPPESMFKDSHVARAANWGLVLTATRESAMVVVCITCVSLCERYSPVHLLQLEQFW